jgi:MFS family permease
MADISLSAPFAEGDFRVGRILNRTSSVLSRNFLPFFIVTAIANLPGPLIVKISTDRAVDAALQNVGIVMLALVLTVMLNGLCQAIVLYGAFQDMRGRRVNLVESLQVGLHRFFSVIVLLFVSYFVIGLAFLLLLVPGFVLLSMWFVATPICVVETLGPIRSLRRSSQLTKGHRWAIFGLILLVAVLGSIVVSIIDYGLEAAAGPMLSLIGGAILNGVWGAFNAIAVVVTYHDLRVAKEGTSIEQIAAVFD